MINVLFGGNHKVFNGILLCLLSMTKYCKDKINVFILTADVTELNKDFEPISQKQKNLLENILKKTNENSKVTLIKLEDEFNNWIYSSSNKSNYYTPFAFLRLFADKIENLPNKIIYLDTDIMINGNIKELFDINIDNVELAVVNDRYGHILIRPQYFNSGMLLMNMEKIKENNLLGKVRDFCSKRKMAFPDQSALNKFCKKKMYLPRRFNEQGRLRNDTIIHHFSKKIKWFPVFHTTNVKPWQINLVHKKYKCFAYDDIFKDYLKYIHSNLER